MKKGWVDYLFLFLDGVMLGAASLFLFVLTIKLTEVFVAAYPPKAKWIEYLYFFGAGSIYWKVFEILYLKKKA